MTLRHMKIFVSVFQTGSITKASHTLHLAQPSVSLAIRELEEHYGVCLFERIGRRIFPTETAKEFYGYALHIISSFEEMEKKFKNWDTLGTLRIGTSITIGTHILPGVLKECQRLFPNLTVEAIINKSSSIEHHILDNTIDIGLIETCPTHSDINFEPFMEDTLCAIVSPDHPLAQKEKVTLFEMAQYPFLMREKGSAGRELLEASFSFMQVSVHPLWESASTQAIVKGVEAGFGVAVLPYLLVKKDLEQHLVKQVSLNPPLRRELNIIHHKNKYLTQNMNSFIQLCKKYGEKHNGCFSI